MGMKTAKRTNNGNDQDDGCNFVSLLPSVGEGGFNMASLWEDEEEAALHTTTMGEQDWQRAKELLTNNPTLVSPRVLLLALQSRPPLDMVECLLRLDPQLAAIPKTGPTALQVAIENGCHPVILRRLLEACPFLIVARTTSKKTVLQLAKELRSNEPEVVQLLRKPLTYWLEQRQYRQETDRKKRSSTTNKTRSGTSKSGQIKFSRSDKKELDNIKVIAATILRAQKRQVHEFELHKHEVANRLNQQTSNPNPPDSGSGGNLFNIGTTTTAPGSFGTFSSGDVSTHQKQQQDRAIRTQLLAMDMKAKAMRYKNKKLERRVMQQLQEVQNAQRNQNQTHAEALESIRREFSQWQKTQEDKMEELEKRMDNEANRNELWRRAVTNKNTTNSNKTTTRTTKTKKKDKSKEKNKKGTSTENNENTNERSQGDDPLQLDISRDESTYNGSETEDIQQDPERSGGSNRVNNREGSRILSARPARRRPLKKVFWARN